MKDEDFVLVMVQETDNLIYFRGSIKSQQKCFYFKNIIMSFSSLTPFQLSRGDKQY